MIDHSPTNPGQPAPGALYVSLVMNAVWGTSLNAGNVAEYLQTGGLPN